MKVNPLAYILTLAVVLVVAHLTGIQHPNLVAFGGVTLAGIWKEFVEPAIDKRIKVG